MVLGGDGTILRGAELARPHGTPVLGVNLGHVGFLAEAEVDDLERIVPGRGRPQLHGRGADDAGRRRRLDGELIVDTWALNEASVEKAARERMLEVMVEVDGRPLSRWGCDGVVCATPTGSTAYAFSAGGPVVWPEVEAMLMVPISAHALFSRPLVVGADVAAVDRAGAVAARSRRAVVRRPADGRAAAGRRDRGPARQAAGPAGAAARSAVHRPAGGQVRAAGARLARRAERSGPGDSQPARRRARSSAGASCASRWPGRRSRTPYRARRHRRPRGADRAHVSPARPVPARRWSSPGSGCCSAAGPTPARVRPGAGRARGRGPAAAGAGRPVAAAGRRRRRRAGRRRRC